MPSHMLIFNRKMSDVQMLLGALLHTCIHIYVSIQLMCLSVCLCKSMYFMHAECYMYSLYVQALMFVMAYTAVVRVFSKVYLYII